MMWNALHAKNKLKFIDGLLKCPSTRTNHYKLWRIINSILVAWILNAIDPKLCSFISFYDTIYYGKLKRMWDDLEDCDPLPSSCCGKGFCAQQLSHIARRDKSAYHSFK
ncbi:hypothetical protein HID58_061620 [Brassica napus]|uniref:Uncharacterized protein n=1 Tax=Brassica napus TaxID=3708 RepID=A0ABQ7ZZ40_BRANA|nr:hypothetical protein HID58_061620 [Brassica napus]